MPLELGNQQQFSNKAWIEFCLFSPAATTTTYSETHR